MNERKYPDLFYTFALSGKAICNKCNRKIVNMQESWEYQGNLYHGYCSQGFDKRTRIGVVKDYKPIK